jgi:hypothetical protein
MVSTRSGRTSSSDNADAVIVHSKTTKPARQTKSKQKKVEDVVVEAVVPAPAEFADTAVVKSKTTKAARQPKSKQMKVEEVIVESSNMEVPLPEPIENPEPVIPQEPKAAKPTRQTKSRQKKVVEVPVESTETVESSSSSVALVVPAAIIEEPVITQNIPEPVLPSVTPKRNKRELEEQQQQLQENDIALPEPQLTRETVSRPVTSNKKPKLEESTKKKGRQPSLAPKNLLETELISVVLLSSDETNNNMEEVLPQEVNETIQPLEMSLPIVITADDVVVVPVAVTSNKKLLSVKKRQSSLIPKNLFETEGKEEPIEDVQPSAAVLPTVTATPKRIQCEQPQEDEEKIESNPQVPVPLAVTTSKKAKTAKKMERVSSPVPQKLSKINLKANTPKTSEQLVNYREISPQEELSTVVSLPVKRTKSTTAKKTRVERSAKKRQSLVPKNLLETELNNIVSSSSSSEMVAMEVAQEEMLIPVVPSPTQTPAKEEQVEEQDQQPVQEETLALSAVFSSVKSNKKTKVERSTIKKRQSFAPKNLFETEGNEEMIPLSVVLPTVTVTPERIQCELEQTQEEEKKIEPMAQDQLAAVPVPLPITSSKKAKSTRKMKRLESPAPVDLPESEMKTKTPQASQRELTPEEDQVKETTPAPLPVKSTTAKKTNRAERSVKKRQSLAPKNLLETELNVAMEVSLEEISVPSVSSPTPKRAKRELTEEQVEEQVQEPLPEETLALSAVFSSVKSSKKAKAERSTIKKRQSFAPNNLLETELNSLLQDSEQPVVEEEKEEIRFPAAPPCTPVADRRESQQMETENKEQEDNELQPMTNLLLTSNKKQPKAEKSAKKRKSMAPTNLLEAEMEVEVPVPVSVPMAVTPKRKDQKEEDPKVEEMSTVESPVPPTSQMKAKLERSAKKKQFLALRNRLESELVLVVPHVSSSSVSVKPAVTPRRNTRDSAKQQQPEQVTSTKKSAKKRQSLAPPQVKPPPPPPRPQQQSQVVPVASITAGIKKRTINEAEKAMNGAPEGELYDVVLLSDKELLPLLPFTATNTPVKCLETLLQSFVTLDSKLDWAKQYEMTTNFRQLFVRHFPLLLKCSVFPDKKEILLKGILKMFSMNLSSLRSSNIRNGLLAIHFFFQSSVLPHFLTAIVSTDGKFAAEWRFDEFLTIIQVLLTKSSNNPKFIAIEAFQTLSKMIELYPLEILFSSFFTEANVLNKNNDISSNIIQLLCEKLNHVFGNNSDASQLQQFLASNSDKSLVKLMYLSLTQGKKAQSKEKMKSFMQKVLLEGYYQNNWELFSEEILKCSLVDSQMEQIKREIAAETNSSASTNNQSTTQSIKEVLKKKLTPAMMIKPVSSSSAKPWLQKNAEVVVSSSAMVQEEEEEMNVKPSSRSTVVIKPLLSSSAKPWLKAGNGAKKQTAEKKAPVVMKQEQQQQQPTVGLLEELKASLAKRQQRLTVQDNNENQNNNISSTSY